MPRVALLKPMLSETPLKGSNIDDVSRSTDSITRLTHYLMNVRRMGVSTGVVAAEATGDGDSLRHFVHNHMHNGTFQMSGFMISQSAFGLNNLITNDKNPIEIAVSLGRVGGADHSGLAQRYLMFKAIIRNVQIAWNIEGPFTAIQLSGIMTDSYQGAGGSALTNLITEDDSLPVS